MSLRRLKNISKKMSFVWRLSDVSSISQKRCIFCDVSETSQNHLLQVFVIFQKYPTKIISCNFRKIIIISDKIDVGPLETLKKLNVFWEQCIDINQICHECQWVDICVRVFAGQRSLKAHFVGVLFTTLSNIFRLIKLYITRWRS